jgi:serine phosphatase RsbU (regulator of sigma subunit)
VIHQEFKYEYDKRAAVDSIKHAEENKVQKAEIEKIDAELKVKRHIQIMLVVGLAMFLIFSVFIYNRFKVTSAQNKIIEKQKNEVEQKKLEAELQRSLVEAKNREIVDSITYAKRLQDAILPPDKLIKEFLPESFIFYKPKDIVAGDFYWFEHKNNCLLFAAADCTGHGVPGAMVSVICNNGLNRSVREYGLVDPGKILDKTREIVIQEFEKSEDEVSDGMDISLCSIEGNKLRWAGANNPLWIIRQDPAKNNEHEFIEYKPNKQPIGKYTNQKNFITHQVDLLKGDTIYIFTDGYQDQFGGEKGKKFKSSNMKQLLLSIQNKEMEEQKEIIKNTFENWKGRFDQVDDVCIVGVRI